MKKINLSLKSIEPFFEKVEKLSRTQRLLVFLGTLLLLVGSFVYFAYMPKFEKIEKLTKESKKLRGELKLVKKEAEDLDKFRKELQAAEEEFKMAMQALPEKKEIPTLLAGISRSGQDSGLEFLLFQPKNEVPQEFYSELPVAIQVSGGYHNVALFFDRVTRLSRIVNMQDIVMSTPGKGKKGATGGPNLLLTSCNAVTYKFIEPGSEQEQAATTGKKKKKKKKK